MLPANPEYQKAVHLTPMKRDAPSLLSIFVARSKMSESFQSDAFECGNKFPRLSPAAMAYTCELLDSVPATTVMSSSQHPVAPIVAPRDLRLFDAIQSGSLEWKRSLFNEYLGLVRGLLIKSMGPQSDVDDLVSEVFVGLFESAGNIRSAAGLRSYVVSVTMNTARREFRRRKRFNLFFLRDEGQEIAERTPGVDDPKAKAALLQLHRILEGLDDEERLVFVLHVLEELPLQEAAANLSVSLSTAKRRLKKANERIRRRVASNPLLSEFVRERASSAQAEDELAGVDSRSDTSPSPVGEG